MTSERLCRSIPEHSNEELRRERLARCGTPLPRSEHHPLELPGDRRMARPQAAPSLLNSPAAQLDALDGDTMPHKPAFLDLNGTLALPVTPQRLSDLQPIPGAFEAVARLTRAGFVCPVITVQSRIAKGLFSLEDFLAWFERFAADAAHYGAVLRGPYVCPHRYVAPCPCKKPQRLLYDQAVADLDLALSESVVIG